MNTMDKKNEQRKLQKTDCMMAMMVGTAVEAQKHLMELMQEYKKKGIDSIKISVIEQLIAESTLKTIMPDGLLGSMIRFKGDK